jgi:hypothetical protein
MSNWLGLCSKHKGNAGTATTAPAPSPSPSPTPSPSTADIQTLQQFLNFMASASPGAVGTVLPGLDLGSVDLSSSPRTIGSNPIILRTLTPGTFFNCSATGNTSAMKLNGWSGVTFDGLRCTHDEVGMAAETTLGIFQAASSAYISLKNCYFGGVLSHVTHPQPALSRENLTGVIMNGSNHLIETTKFERLAWGLYNQGATDNCLYQLNLFDHIQEHCIHQESGANNCQVLYNLQDMCTAQWNGSGYDDHGDFYISYTTDGLSAIHHNTISGNMIRQFGETTGRGQGIYLDNEGTVGTNIHDITVTNNITMGTLAHAIFMNGVGSGTNLVDGNEMYWEQGSTEAGTAILRSVNSTGTYSNNKGDKLIQGSPTMTAGSGNDMPSGGYSITQAAMATKVATFRALHPTIPAST